MPRDLGVHFMRNWGIVALAVTMGGCAIQRAQIAQDARVQMIGLSKEQVLICMGNVANTRLQAVVKDVAGEYVEMPAGKIDVFRVGDQLRRNIFAKCHRFGENAAGHIGNGFLERVEQGRAPAASVVVSYRFGCQPRQVPLARGAHRLRPAHERPGQFGARFCAMVFGGRCRNVGHCETLVSGFTMPWRQSTLRRWLDEFSFSS
jgi:hypothetical protein